MSKTKSLAAAKAKSKSVLAGIKGRIKEGSFASASTGALKDIAVGGIGGGVAGVLIGKPSLLIGIGTSFVGNYLKSSIITSFGVGMMASGSYQVMSGVNGTSVNGLQGIKDRLKAFGTGLKQRLYIDKIIKPKAPASETTNGLGNVQYFKYPSQELDMSALDRIESAIAQSGAQYNQKLSGMYDDIAGVADKLY